MSESYIYPEEPEVAWRNREDRDTCIGAGRLVDRARGGTMFLDVEAILGAADILPENREAALAEAIRQLAFFNCVRGMRYNQHP